MIYFLLFFSILNGTLKNMFSKQLGAMDRSVSQIHLSNSYTMLLSFILFVIINGGFTKASVFTVITGVLYAVFSLGSQITLIAAMNSGPVAFTSLFFSCGFVISTILSLLPLELWQRGQLLCMFYRRGKTCLC